MEQSPGQTYSLSMMDSDRNLFVSILLGTLRHETVNQAQSILSSFENENIEQYCVLLSDELGNENSPDFNSRIVAGGQLKNMVKAQGRNEKDAKANLWLGFQPENRVRITDNAKRALQSTIIQVANSAALVISAIGVIEVQRGVDTSLIMELLKNIQTIQTVDTDLLPKIIQVGNDPNTQSQNPSLLPTLLSQHRLNMNLKRASITSLRYLCEDLPIVCLEKFQDELLTIIVSTSLDYAKVYRDESDDEAEVEALSALQILLPAVHERMSQKGPRDMIIKTIMGPLVAIPEQGQPDRQYDHRVKGYRCLIDLADLYYPFITEYAETIFECTISTIKKDQSEIISLAIEVWNAIVSFEASLKFRNRFPERARMTVGQYFANTHPIERNAGLTEKGADQLTNLMMETILSVDEADDPTSRPDISAALSLLSSILSAVDSDELFTKLSSFVLSNLVMVSGQGQSVLSVQPCEQAPSFNCRAGSVYVLILMVMGTIMGWSNLRREEDLLESLRTTPDAKSAFEARSNQATQHSQTLNGFVKEAFNILLQGMLGDDSYAVRTACAFAVHTICAELPFLVIPEKVTLREVDEKWMQTMVSLQQGLTSTDSLVARESAASIKTLARTCTDEQRKKPYNFVNQMLGQLYEPLFGILARGDAGDGALLVTQSTRAMEEMINNCGLAARVELSRKLGAVLDEMTTNQNQPVGLLTAELTIIKLTTLKIEHSIQSHFSKLAGVLARLTQINDMTFQQTLLDTLNIVAHFSSPYDTSFFESLGPYLMTCLSQDQIWPIQRTALDVIAMFAMQLEGRFAPFVATVLPPICEMFTRQTQVPGHVGLAVDERVLPSALMCISDTMLSTHVPCLFMLEPILNIIRLALQTPMNLDAPRERRANVVELYSNALQTLITIYKKFTPQAATTPELQAAYQFLEHTYCPAFIGILSELCMSITTAVDASFAGEHTLTHLAMRTVDLMGNDFIDTLASTFSLFLDSYPSCQPHFFVGDDIVFGIKFLLNVCSAVKSSSIQNNIQQLRQKVTLFPLSS
ncbi:hypothetical protein BLNAU_7766 [Blattamonas nauphoetae]|uniref:Importin N-terminal domain-containing protein n=1 Tax=Blattamonas nauphoetae TaxID=2049346 RepID=A0ABQ9Y090_9EUKA|nr:hypothetical protein BLNAU_7766 [Blattamonas nauphoetae]